MTDPFVFAGIALIVLGVALMAANEPHALPVFVIGLAVTLVALLVRWT